MRAVLLVIALAWSVTAVAEVRVRTDADAGGMVFTPDGAGLLVASGDVELFATNTWTATKNFDESRKSIAVSPDGKVAYLGSDYTKDIVVLDVASWEKRRVIVTRPVESGDVVVSGDGKRVAIGGRYRCVVVDAETDKELRTVSFDDGGVNDVSLDRTGGLVACCAYREGGGMVVDVATDKVRVKLPGRGIRVAFSPDDRWLAYANADDHTVTIYDTKQFRVKARIHYKESVQAIAFDAASRRIAIGGVRADDDSKKPAPKIVISDLTGKVLTRLAPAAGGARVLAFTPDGKQLAAAGFDRSLVVHNVPN